jgi:hypothetical protein
VDSLRVFWGCNGPFDHARQNIFLSYLNSSIFKPIVCLY